MFVPRQLFSGEKLSDKFDDWREDKTIRWKPQRCKVKIMFGSSSDKFKQKTLSESTSKIRKFEPNPKPSFNRFRSRLPRKWFAGHENFYRFSWRHRGFFLWTLFQRQCQGNRIEHHQANVLYDGFWRRLWWAELSFVQLHKSSIKIAWVQSQLLGHNSEDRPLLAWG